MDSGLFLWPRDLKLRAGFQTARVRMIAEKARWPDLERILKEGKGRTSPYGYIRTAPTADRYMVVTAITRSQAAYRTLKIGAALGRMKRKLAERGVEARALTRMVRFEDFHAHGDFDRRWRIENAKEILKKPGDTRLPLAVTLAFRIPQGAEVEIPLSRRGIERDVRMEGTRRRKKRPTEASLLSGTRARRLRPRR